MPPSAPLRLNLLRVHAPHALPDLHALLADVAAHASLTGLALHMMPDGGLDAVVDVALARAFTAFALSLVHLTATTVPPLVRLLRDGALHALQLDCRWLDAPGAAALAGALRANTTLTRVTLLALRRDTAATAALLDALTGHAHVRCVWLLDVPSYYVPACNAPLPHAPDALPDALGALVRANAAALQEVVLSGYLSAEPDLCPLVDALPSNTHLRCACSPCFRPRRATPHKPSCAAAC